MLLSRESWQTREKTSHVVLSVPLGQSFEELADGVIRANLFRTQQVLDVRFRITLFVGQLLSSSDDNTHLGFRCQLTILGLILGRQLSILNFSAQHVVAEEIIVF